MRILIYHMHTGLVGGSETYVRSILHALHQAGQDLAFVHEAQPSSGSDAVCDGLPIPAWSVAEDEEAALARCRAWEPDLVYLHGFEKLELVQRLATEYPCVYFAHAYGGLCVSGTRRHRWPTSAVCQRQLGPGCLLCYFPRRCGGWNPVTMWSLYQKEQMRRQVLRRCARILVHTDYFRQVFLRHDFPAEQVQVITYFTPDQKELPPPSRSLSGRVAFVGRLVEAKGVRLLAKAVAAAARQLRRPLTLLLIGDGPEREGVRRDCARLGVPVESPGWVDVRRRHELLTDVDLLLVPSLWPEPFGLVGVEAGCAGVPAVAFAVGGIPAWLEPGLNGELAAAQRPTARRLAEAMVRVLGDESRWRQLCHGAWQVAARHSLAAHLQQLLAIFREVGRPRQPLPTAP